MGNFGLRISQAGVPIDKAADYQMIFDDRWPLLEMLVMDVMDVAATTGAPGSLAFVPLFRHDLGYLPTFRFIPISYTGFDTFGQAVTDFVYADETFIYIMVNKTSGVDVRVTFKFFLSIIDRNCNNVFAAPIDVVTASDASGPSNYGLKIQNDPSPQGMGEGDKTKYTFNTNEKTFAVQCHGIATFSNLTHTVDIYHYLGYPPTYFVAKIEVQDGTANPKAGLKLIKPMGNGGAISKNNSIMLTLKGAQGDLAGDYQYLILKDPVDLAK